MNGFPRSGLAALGKEGLVKKSKKGPVIDDHRDLLASWGESGIQAFRLHSDVLGKHHNDSQKKQIRADHFIFF